MLFSRALLSAFAVGLAFSTPNPTWKYNTSQPAEVSAISDSFYLNTPRLDNYIVVMNE